MGVFNKIIQRTMPILSSIPSPCITPSMCWVIVHLIIILLLFRVDVLNFFQIHSDRKLTDPHFQEKLWPISVHFASAYNCLLVKLLRQNCLQTKHLWEAVLLFWDKDIAFLGHTKWSTKHIGSEQRGTAKDTRLQVLAALNHSGTDEDLYKQSFVFQ